MEIDPKYTQSPSMLDQIYVSTAGGAPNAVALSNLPGGSVTQIPPAGGSAAAAAAGSASLDTARNATTNALAASGNSSASAGAAVSTIKETMVPLSAVSGYRRANTALSINHEGPFVTTTISFNLDPKDSLSDGLDEIHAAEAQINMPASVHGAASGAALLFVGSASAFPLLVLAAILSMYIVLGILYESLIHPITILSTLPSAGVGALLSLAIFDIELDVISGIGVILLIGLVKKNAIMLVDFAINAKRNHGASSRDAIYEACLLRLRPILMTTFAAMFGALPLALSFGEGGEMRRPLGVVDHRRPDRQPVADPVHDAGHLSLSRPFQPLAEGQARRLARPPSAGLILAKRKKKTAGPEPGGVFSALLRKGIIPRRRPERRPWRRRRDRRIRSPPSRRCRHSGSRP